MIRLSKSYVGEDEAKAVREVLLDGYLGMGKFVGEFEEILADYFGRPAVCVSTGTAALQLSLQAIGLKPGDEVLVPALTYLASFQAITAAGCKPVACDIDPITLFIDIDDANERLTNKTKAIMPVFYASSIGNLVELSLFAKKNKLRIIEDAAHAFGSRCKSELIGSFGDISCFSFDGIKNITSGEGGCIVSNDEQFIQRVRDIRLLGVQNDSVKRLSGARSWNFDVVEQGWRYHMSNIMASIGITQFNKKSVMFSKRQELAQHYDKILKTNSDIKLLPLNYSEIVPHIYVVQIKNLRDRTKLRKQLLDKGIETGLHYLPNNYLTLFKSDSNRHLSVTDNVWPELLSLPLHPALEFQDIDYVCKHLLEIITKSNDKPTSFT
jgi:dTDP-4-amino-4,6-dideoxygalactose transaminase